jgi:hypothetical protein
MIFYQLLRDNINSLRLNNFFRFCNVVFNSHMFNLHVVNAFHFVFLIHYSCDITGKVRAPNASSYVKKILGEDVIWRP